MAMLASKEALSAFNVPAKWADRFSVAARPHGIRIAFGEIALDDKTFNFHTAVIVNVPTAEMLAHGLEDILLSLRRALEEAKQPSSR